MHKLPCQFKREPSTLDITRLSLIVKDSTPPAGGSLVTDEYKDVYTNVSNVKTYPDKSSLPRTEKTDVKEPPQKQSQHGAGKCTIMCEDDPDELPEGCGYNPRIVSLDFPPCSRGCSG